MTRRCKITNKGTIIGGGYSNKTRATQFNPTGKRGRKANLQQKKLYIPELDKNLTLKVSARGIKIINKKGVYKALKDAKII